MTAVKFAHRKNIYIFTNKDYDKYFNRPDSSEFAKSIYVVNPSLTGEKIIYVH